MLFSFFKFCLVFFFFWKTGAEELRKSIKVITSKCFNKDRSIFTYECFSQFGCFYGKGTNETHFTATICVTLLVCSVQYRACCPCCKSCSLYLSHLYGMGRWKLYVMWQPAKKIPGRSSLPTVIKSKNTTVLYSKSFSFNENGRQHNLCIYLFKIFNSVEMDYLPCSSGNKSNTILNIWEL